MIRVYCDGCTKPLEDADEVYGLYDSIIKGGMIMVDIRGFHRPKIFCATCMKPDKHFGKGVKEVEDRNDGGT